MQGWGQKVCIDFDGFSGGGSWVGKHSVVCGTRLVVPSLRDSVAWMLPPDLRPGLSHSAALRLEQIEFAGSRYPDFFHPEFSESVAEAD